jgi:hypothetical protein
LNIRWQMPQFGPIAKISTSRRDAALVDESLCFGANERPKVFHPADECIHRIGMASKLGSADVP